MLIKELFKLINDTASSSAKTEIMRQNMTDLVKDIYETTYGEHNYFVSKLDLEKTGDLIIDDNWMLFKQVLNDCENRVITGNNAKNTVKAVLEKFTVEDQTILYNVLQHNLKIGLSYTSFLNITGKKAEQFEVSLAYNLDKVKGVNPIDGTYFSSRKLDGVRCICIVDATNPDDVIITFKSRQNKTFSTLDKLVSPIKNFADWKGAWVLDGECCILDENGDEHFDWVMKEINRKDHIIENPCYNIFDMLTLEEFEGKTKSDIFEHRYAILKELYKSCKDTNRIHLLKQELIKSQEDFDRWTGYVSEGHWEGFMLRKNTYYESGRTKQLLKVKKFKDAEYTVLDVIKGTAVFNEDGNKERPIVSALVIEHNGNQVLVGSGLSKEQRLEWYDNPQNIIGKTITVQYFEETTDSKTGKLSLRFPVLKYVYEKGRNC